MKLLLNLVCLKQNLIEKHITQVHNALTTLQWNMDLLLNSVVHAQTGGIQPQIVPPRLLLDSLRENQPFFST